MMTTTALTTLTKSHNGIVFTFRSDGWFNMTKAAKTYGKDLQSFMRMDDTASYVEALKANSVSETELTQSTAGRYGGTWAHPKLAVFFARWLDVKFSVWCDAVIEDILKGAAEVVIVKPKESKFCRTFSRPDSMRFPGLSTPVPRVGPHPLRL